MTRKSFEEHDTLHGKVVGRIESFFRENGILKKDFAKLASAELDCSYKTAIVYLSLIKKQLRNDDLNDIRLRRLSKLLYIIGCRTDEKIINGLRESYSGFVYPPIAEFDFLCFDCGNPMRENT